MSSTICLHVGNPAAYYAARRNAVVPFTPNNGGEVILALRLEEGIIVTTPAGAEVEAGPGDVILPSRLCGAIVVKQDRFAENYSRCDASGKVYTTQEGLEAAQLLRLPKDEGAHRHDLLTLMCLRVERTMDQLVPWHIGKGLGLGRDALIGMADQIAIAGPGGLHSGRILISELSLEYICDRAATAAFVRLWGDDAFRADFDARPESYRDKVMLSWAQMAGNVIRGSWHSGEGHQNALAYTITEGDPVLMKRLGIEMGQTFDPKNLAPLPAGNGKSIEPKVELFSPRGKGQERPFLMGRAHDGAPIIDVGAFCDAGIDHAAPFRPRGEPRLIMGVRVVEDVEYYDEKMGRKERLPAGGVFMVHVSGLITAVPPQELAKGYARAGMKGDHLMDLSAPADRQRKFLRLIGDDEAVLRHERDLRLMDEANLTAAADHSLSFWLQQGCGFPVEKIRNEVRQQMEESRILAARKELPASEAAKFRDRIRKEVAGVAQEEIDRAMVHRMARVLANQNFRRRFLAQGGESCGKAMKEWGQFVRAIVAPKGFLKPLQNQVVIAGICGDDALLRGALEHMLGPRRPGGPTPAP